jgi:hypothetical protein
VHAGPPPEQPQLLLCDQQLPACAGCHSQQQPLLAYHVCADQVQTPEAQLLLRLLGLLRIINIISTKGRLTWVLLTMLLFLFWLPLLLPCLLLRLLQQGLLLLLLSTTLLLQLRIYSVVLQARLNSWLLLLVLPCCMVWHSPVSWHLACCCCLLILLQQLLDAGCNKFNSLLLQPAHIYMQQ